MRRMILVLVVAAVLVAMAATPAFAGSSVGSAGGGDCRAGCVNINGIGDGPKGAHNGGHKGGGGEGPSALGSQVGSSSGGDIRL
jgi:hypothetical protein